MSTFIERLGRLLRPADERRTVHFHRSTFWSDEQPEICFDPDCGRPSLPLD